MHAAASPVGESCAWRGRPMVTHSGMVLVARLANFAIVGAFVGEPTPNPFALG